MCFTILRLNVVLCWVSLCLGEWLTSWLELALLKSLLVDVKSWWQQQWMIQVACQLGWLSDSDMKIRKFCAKYQDVLTFPFFCQFEGPLMHMFRQLTERWWWWYRMKSPVQTLSDDEEFIATECKRRRTESDSDEEVAFCTVPGHQKVVEKVHVKKSPQPKAQNAVALRLRLAKLSQKMCRCGHAAKAASRKSCLRQFRDDGELEALYQLRLQMGKLSKQDFDNKVVELLKVQSDSGRKQQVILTQPVCQHAFRTLLGIGSDRYARLKKAANQGVAAPLDGRTVRRGKNVCSQKKSVRKRSLVIEYLTELYNTVSEPMPEACKILNKLKTESETQGEASSSKPLELKKFRRSRGRRPRLAAQLHRGNIRPDMRVLPPGTFTDYLVMLKARHPTEKFSMKFFTKDSWLHYSWIAAALWILYIQRQWTKGFML